MMPLFICDICQGGVIVRPDGKTGVCEDCGMKYCLERIQDDKPKDAKKPPER